VAEVTVAAYDFFDELKVSCAARDRAQKLIYVRPYIHDKVDPNMPVIQPPNRFAEMDSALASLDGQRRLKVDTLVDAIRKIYSKN